MKENRPLVSVIVPCYNEEKFIPSLMGCILSQDYPAEKLEIFFIDGMSNDATRELVEKYRSDKPDIHLLLNKQRFVPFALNLGIKNCHGEVIIRMDAHSQYPVNYISTLVRYLLELNADNVGGVWITKPANCSLKALAIAGALSSVFGVGNSYFRIGSSEIRKADTVPYGCFRRGIFDKIGLFDQELLRNQDDEFNARILENGGTIYLIPEVTITYHARPDLTSLIKMFYQYGFFKPLVNIKLRQPATIRQFIPPLFVLFLLFGWTGFLVAPAGGLVFLAGLCLYLLGDLFFTFKGMVDGRRFLLLFYMPWIFFLVHVAYGWGYLAGTIKFVILRKRQMVVSSSR